jgi:DNA-binding HxlR family transcriptional regulator
MNGEKNAGVDWLLGKTEDAASGIDAAIYDMFKSLGNPSHTRILEELVEEPQRFNELKTKLNLHQEKLNRNLRDLQEHNLAKKSGRVYEITPFGKHVLGIVHNLMIRVR